MYIGVDVGGTFTDIAVNKDDGSNLLLYKLASTPDAPERAIIEGLQTILEQTGVSADRVGTPGPSGGRGPDVRKWRNSTERSPILGRAAAAPF